MVSKAGKMAQNTKATGKMDKCMDMVYIYNQMEIPLMDSGKKINFMEKVFRNFQMAELLTENLKME